MSDDDHPDHIKASARVKIGKEFEVEASVDSTGPGTWAVRYWLLAAGSVLLIGAVFWTSA